MKFCNFMYIKVTVHSSWPHRETEIIQVRIDNRPFTPQWRHLLMTLKTVPCTLLLAILSSMPISPSTRLYDYIFTKGFFICTNIFKTITVVVCRLMLLCSWSWTDVLKKRMGIWTILVCWSLVMRLSNSELLLQYFIALVRCTRNFDVFNPCHITKAITRLLLLSIRGNFSQQSTSHIQTN